MNDSPEVISVRKEKRGIGGFLKETLGRGWDLIKGLGVTTAGLVTLGLGLAIGSGFGPIGLAIG